MSNLEKKCYVGIDVAKAKLDVFVWLTGEHFVVKNNSQGIEVLIGKMIKLASKEESVHIAMESTGGYEQLAANLLSQSGLKVSILNPRQVRDFAKSLNKLAKTDKIDAQVIAEYAKVVMPREMQHYPEGSKKIAQLENRRRQLLGVIQAERNRLDKNSGYIQQSIERVIECMKKELEEVEKELEKSIEEDETNVQKRKILMSVKGIGKITAHALIANLPELGYLNGKEISSLCGLAPFNRDSGTLRGKRSIWGGRRIVRAGLYMGTLVAIRHNRYIKTFYEKLIAAGKSKMTAIVAAMHKLLLILNAMVKSNSIWDEKKEEEYIRAMNLEIKAIGVKS